MKKYIVTIENRIETFNIIGISEYVLFDIVGMYYEKEPEMKLGGREFSLADVLKMDIHEFDNENQLDQFLAQAKESGGKKKSVSGNEYFDADTISSFAKDVTMAYLTLKTKTEQKAFLTSDYSAVEGEEISGKIDEIIVRLSKIELGQQIIYDDLKEELEELKLCVGITSKKSIRQLLIGKLVDAGLGTFSEEVFNVIKHTTINELQ